MHAVHEKPPALQGIATSGETLQNRGMEAAGIEPASRDISMGASTCVVGSFTRLACRPLTDGVSGRASRELFLASCVPSSDPRRFGFGDEFLGLSD